MGFIDIFQDSKFFFANRSTQNPSKYFLAPQSVFRDCDNAFGALFGGEAGGVLERTVAERRQVESALVAVEEPGSTGAREKLKNKIINNWKISNLNEFFEN